jgi:DNA primase large subunit
LQLGYFLKKIGMHVDDQLHFWYEKSVDNVGQTFSEFTRTSGYQIRHLYGLEGGKKDYNVPKCSTIATSYFCPFDDLEPSTLGDFLRKNYYTEKKRLVFQESQVNSLISKSTDNPTRVCTQYFRFVYGRSWHRDRKIVHPLQWTRYAMKIEGLTLEEKPEKAPEVQEEDKQ